MHLIMSITKIQKNIYILDTWNLLIINKTKKDSSKRLTARSIQTTYINITKSRDLKAVYALAKENKPVKGKRFAIG